jgi:hypothetical protein
MCLVSHNSPRGSSAWQLRSGRLRESQSFSAILLLTAVISQWPRRHHRGNELPRWIRGFRRTPRRALKACSDPHPWREEEERGKITGQNSARWSSKRRRPRTTHPPHREGGDGDSDPCMPPPPSMFWALTRDPCTAEEARGARKGGPRKHAHAHSRGASARDGSWGGSGGEGGCR